MSTVLSLIFVPGVLTIIDSFGRAIWWMFGRFVGPEDEPEPTALVVASAPSDFDRP